MTSESLSETTAKASLPTRLSWPFALALAVGAIYLPQLVMCLYTTAFVSCSHCKLGVWIVAPFAPGGFIWELIRHSLNLPRLSDILMATASGCLSVLIAVAMAAASRRIQRWRWRSALLGTTLVAATFLAYAVLGLMRA